MKVKSFWVIQETPNLPRRVCGDSLELTAHGVLCSGTLLVPFTNIAHLEVEKEASPAPKRRGRPPKKVADESVEPPKKSRRRASKKTTGRQQD